MCVCVCGVADLLLPSSCTDHQLVSTFCTPFKLSAYQTCKLRFWMAVRRRIQLFNLHSARALNFVVWTLVPPLKRSSTVPHSFRTRNHCSPTLKLFNYGQKCFKDCRIINKLCSSKSPHFVKGFSHGCLTPACVCVFFFFSQT